MQRRNGAHDKHVIWWHDTEATCVSRERVRTMMDTDARTHSDSLSHWVVFASTSQKMIVSTSNESLEVATKSSRVQLHRHGGRHGHVSGGVRLPGGFAHLNRREWYGSSECQLLLNWVNLGDTMHARLDAEEIILSCARTPPRGHSYVK